MQRESAQRTERGRLLIAASPLLREANPRPCLYEAERSCMELSASKQRRQAAAAAAARSKSARPQSPLGSADAVSSLRRAVSWYLRALSSGRCHRSAVRADAKYSSQVGLKPKNGHRAPLRARTSGVGPRLQRPVSAGGYRHVRRQHYVQRVR